MDRVRVHVVVRGRVQGVFFRDGCRRRALEEGVTGWVRNRPDASVEAEIQGPPGAVEAVVAWCRVGPPAARVTAVEVVAIPPEPAPEGFVIR